MKSSIQLFCAIALTVTVGTLAGCGSSSSKHVSTAPGQSTVAQDDGIDSFGNLIEEVDNTDTGFPNDGSIGGEIIENGVVVAGSNSQPQKGFICQRSASFQAGSYIEVGANGLIGGLLKPLLNLLSGDSLNNLLNGLNDRDLALDANMRTAASVTQTLSGLGGLLNSMDVTVHFPDGKHLGAGSYAVFAVSFPPSLLELGLLSRLRVKTYIGESLQESGASIDTSAVSLLGLSTDQIGQGNRFALVGYKVTKPYDKAQLLIKSNLLSLNIGEKLYIHEFCTGGALVTPPT